MRISQHATVRSKQRGTSAECIEMIIDFGTPERKPGGAFEYKLDKRNKAKLIRELKRKLQLLDRISRKAVLVSADCGEIITVYNLI